MALTSGLGGRLTIDLSALARNWRALDQVSASALTAAVVKADAYGTGLHEAVTTLFATGARFFFTSTVDEAIEVRRTAPSAYVFVLNGLYPGAGEIYLQERLMPVISSLAMLEEWLRLCISRGEAFPAALHFDTGMNRLGLRLNEVDIVRQKIDSVGFQPQMVMSHLACADQPSHEKNRAQLALFQTVTNSFPNIPASLANSAGLMSGREFHFQLVRPGIALYGGRAVTGRRNPMAPVVRLDVPILQIKEGKTGETVGYGATQTLVRDSRLAVLALGYADGFMRSLSSTNARGGGRIYARGKTLPIMGRVSMDLCIADLTELGADLPLPGDFVEVLGPHISVDDQADAGNTIGYEILTSLKSGRYVRNYLGERAEAVQ